MKEPETLCIAVAGGANIDIGGTSAGTLKLHDSAIGGANRECVYRIINKAV